MSSHRVSPALLAAGAVLVLAGGALPAHGESFNLHLAPLVVEGNSLDVDTNSSKVQEYRDLSSGFRVRLLALTGATDDGARLLRFQVVNGGKRDGFYGLSYDVAGSWRMKLSYDQIPHRFGNDGHVLFTQTSPGVWELPDPMQQANQNFIVANRPLLNFTLLNGQLAPWLATAHAIDLGLERKRTRAQFRLGSAGGTTWNFEYRHEDRDGNRAYGSSFGFSNAVELPEPIDYKTDDAILSADWRFGSGLVTAGYQYSKFTNDTSTMYFDNPWRATDATDPSAYSAPGTGSVGGAARGFADLAADNRASSLFARGRFDLGGGWLQAAVNYTRFEQDDSLLPYTLNSAINESTGAPFDATDPANLPHSSANRESTMLRATADYGRRFGDGWQLGVRYAYLDYSDSSDRYEFPGYVRFHAVWEDVPRITVPFSWTRGTLSATLDKDLGKAGTVGLEVKQDVWQRDFRETDKTTEDLVALSWNGRAGPALLRAKYEWGQRDFNGRYDTDAAEASFADPETSNNQPGLRRFDQAARDSRRWYASVDLPFAEVWNVRFDLRQNNYDYNESEMGLTGDDTTRYGVELSWDAGAGGSFFLFGERADRDVSMASRQSGATPSTNPLDSWFADFTEVNDTVGVGWSRDHERWHAKARGAWEKSDGKADLFSPPGGTPDVAVGFGNYEDYDILSAEGTVDYDVTAALSFGVRVLYEDYTIDSFIRQGLRNYLPGTLLIVADDGDYRAWSTGLRMSVRF